MPIFTFFNNWKSNEEMILLELSYSKGVIVVALLGFGIVINLED